MYEHFICFGLNHKKITLSFLAILTVFFTLGVFRIEIGTDFSQLIADSDPNKQIYLRVANEFGSDNKSLVYVEDNNLWQPEKLEALSELNKTLKSLGFAERVESLFSINSIRGSSAGISVGPILGEALASHEAIETARNNAFYNPFIVGNYLSRDGKATAFLVSVRPNLKDPFYESKVHKKLEEAIKPFINKFDTLFQIGAPRINTELNQALHNDLKLLGPLSALVLVSTIFIFLRSKIGALLPLITSAISITWAFGMMGWAGIHLNILNAMLPSLIIAIGSTEDTHLVAGYLRGLHKGISRQSAARQMLIKLGVPLILTIITTVLGFASNVFSPISLIKEFALISTFALFSNGLVTWLLLPIILSWLGPEYKEKIHGRSPTGVAGFFVRLFTLTRKHFSTGILLFTALLCSFFLYMASQLEVTNDPLSYFKKDRLLLQEVRKAEQELSGLKVFFITLEAENLKAFLNPEALQKIDKIQSFIDSQEAFDNHISILDLLKLINREFHNGDPNDFDIPANRELVAQFMLFLHRNDLSPYISNDFHRVNIVVRHNITDSRALNNHISELEEAVERITGPRFKAYIIGENLMINAAAEKLLVGQVTSLTILLAVIFVLMSGMFTSFKGGLIAMVPGVIPIILMFGVMGLLDIPLNPGTAMVAVIAIGVAVDGTIHILSSYNERCRRTSNYLEAVQETVVEESLPAVATALALSLGFGLLLLSEFSIIAQFGALSAATMLFSIFANLLITPIIMTRTRLVGLYEILTMSVHQRVFDESPLFKGMSRYEIRKAILISELNEIKEGELLIKQGNHDRSMYLILEGRAEVSVNTENGKHFISEVSEGDVIGEIAFVRPIERTADVKALTDLKVLRYDFETIGKDLRFFPNLVAKLNFNISGILGERLAKTIEAAR